MSNSAYFDVVSETAIPVRYGFATNDTFQQVRPDARIQICPVMLVLQDALFTGNVTMANWTFAISVMNKLWISRKTSLYFGKTRKINRPVFSDSLQIENHRLSLELDITAYNMYGDIIKTKQTLQMFFANNKRYYHNLVQTEQNRTYLSLRFATVLGKSCETASAA